MGNARVLLLGLVLLSLPTAATAGVALWGSDGISVCGDECNTNRYFSIPDGDGGAYITWRDSRAPVSLGEDVYLQRIRGDGTIFPGWPSDGLAVCNLTENQNPFAIAPDGFDGALVIWQDFRNVVSGTSGDIYAQRVLADGSISPGWVSNGVPIAVVERNQRTPEIISDGSGGAYATWTDNRDFTTTREDVYVQHIGPDGSPVLGWQENGILVTNRPEQQRPTGEQSLLLDETGGVVLVWNDCTEQVTCDTYAIRLHANGAIASGWQAGGNLLNSIAWLSEIVPDSQGGFYVATEEGTPTNFDLRNYYLQHYDINGLEDPSWPVGGVKVCCPDGVESMGMDLTFGGPMGVFVNWNVDTDFRRDQAAVRVLPDGSLAPGWPFGGRIFNGASQVNPKSVDMIEDGEGGMFVAWEWGSSFSTVSVQHLTATGEVTEGWPDDGIEVSEEIQNREPKLASDGMGGVIVFWGRNNRGIRAQRFVDDDVVQTKLSLVLSEVEDGVVTLQWHEVGVSALGKQVYRRTDSSTWEALGTPHLLSGDRIGFEDSQVSPGARYAYRLGYLEGVTERFTSETWLTIPTGELHLAGFRPNPARDIPQIQFTLPTAHPALLEVVDVRGRMVLREDVGVLGPGEHIVDLTAQSQLLPGVYWIRLTQGERTQTARGVLLR